jgi:protein arginine N-methyltransferase 1
MTVLDLGTGPYAVLAFAAARAGAKKVYCIEADPAVAERARQEIQWAETTIPKGVMEVIEGFSTDIELPEPVDLLVCEIAGSIASEEGMYATIGDARRRFMQRPNDPASYIPYSYETWGAPCTDMVHHSGGADAERKCTRVEADDATLQLLADPRLVEDIRLADADFPASGTVSAASALVWRVDPSRICANKAAFRKRLKGDEGALRAQGIELGALTEEISQSLSGIALWPRIVFDEAGSLVYDSRGHPDGEHQMSHWQTFVPYLSSRPVRIEPEDVISAAWEADLQDGKVATPLKYSIECVINAEAEVDTPSEPLQPRLATSLAHGDANVLSDAVARLSGADAVGLRQLAPAERQELLRSLVRALVHVQAECDGS